MSNNNIRLAFTRQTPPPSIRPTDAFFSISRSAFLQRPSQHHSHPQWTFPDALPISKVPKMIHDFKDIKAPPYNLRITNRYFIPKYVPNETNNSANEVTFTNPPFQYTTSINDFTDSSAIFHATHQQQQQPQPQPQSQHQHHHQRQHHLQQRKEPQNYQQLHHSPSSSSSLSYLEELERARHSKQKEVFSSESYLTQLQNHHVYEKHDLQTDTQRHSLNFDNHHQQDAHAVAGHGLDQHQVWNIEYNSLHSTHNQHPLSTPGHSFDRNQVYNLENNHLDSIQEKPKPEPELTPISTPDFQKKVAFQDLQINSHDTGENNNINSMSETTHNPQQHKQQSNWWSFIEERAKKDTRLLENLIKITFDTKPKSADFLNLTTENNNFVDNKDLSHIDLDYTSTQKDTPFNLENTLDSAHQNLIRSNENHVNTHNQKQTTGTGLLVYIGERSRKDTEKVRQYMGRISKSSVKKRKSKAFKNMARIANQVDKVISDAALAMKGIIFSALQNTKNILEASSQAFDSKMQLSPTTKSKQQQTSDDLSVLSNNADLVKTQTNPSAIPTKSVSGTLFNRIAPKKPEDDLLKSLRWQWKAHQKLKRSLSYTPNKDSTSTLRNISDSLSYENILESEREKWRNAAFHSIQDQKKWKAPSMLKSGVKVLSDIHTVGRETVQASIQLYSKSSGLAKNGDDSFKLANLKEKAKKTALLTSLASLALLFGLSSSGSIVSSAFAMATASVSVAITLARAKNANAVMPETELLILKNRFRSKLMLSLKNSSTKHVNHILPKNNDRFRRNEPFYAFSKFSDRRTRNFSIPLKSTRRNKTHDVETSVSQRSQATEVGLEKFGPLKVEATRVTGEYETDFKTHHATTIPNEPLETSAGATDKYEIEGDEIEAELIVDTHAHVISYETIESHQVKRERVYQSVDSFLFQVEEMLDRLVRRVIVSGIMPPTLIPKQDWQLLRHLKTMDDERNEEE